MTDHKPKPFLARFPAALKSARLETPQGRSSCGACRLTAGWPESAVVLCQQRQTRFSGKKSFQTFPSLDIDRTLCLKDVVFCHRYYFFSVSPCLPPPLHTAHLKIIVIARMDTVVKISGFGQAYCLKVKVKLLSRVRLFATQWTVAYQAPPSMGFSRQECWSGLPFPSPGDLPDPGIEPRSPALKMKLYKLSIIQIAF